MPITYSQPKPRGTITQGRVVYFSADTKHRTVRCVIDEGDGNTVLNRLTLEFTDDTDPSYTEFVQSVNAGQFRDTIETYIATIPLTGGSVS